MLSEGQKGLPKLLRCSIVAPNNNIREALMKATVTNWEDSGRG